MQDRDHVKGKVIAFLSGEDITKDPFNRMGLGAEETDYYFRRSRMEDYFFIPTAHLQRPLNRIPQSNTITSSF